MISLLFHVHVASDWLLHDGKCQNQNVLFPNGLNWVQHLMYCLFSRKTWFKNRHFSDAGVGQNVLLGDGLIGLLLQALTFNVRSRAHKFRNTTLTDFKRFHESILFVSAHIQWK